MRIPSILAPIALLNVCLLADDPVIALKVEGAGGPGMDTRVFSVPLVCNGAEAHFIWGCGGWTIVSESFAEKASLKVRDDPDVAGFAAADGKPIFAGSADTDIRLGARSHRENVKVMRDKYADRGMAGIVGYAIARQYQWEVNPDWTRPTLTLRSPGSRPTSQPVAVVPLKDDDDNLWLKVKVRGEAVDLCLIPQSTDMQAGPELQRRWDIASGKATDIKSFMGSIRTVMLMGKDAVELAPQFVESNVRVILVGSPKDEPNPSQRSGLGASLLNRFIYCVDPQEGKFMILGRPRPPKATMPVPTTRRP
jgi:hypothetical protein